MQVWCEVEEIELDGDYETADGDAAAVPSVRVHCRRCRHWTECYGTTDASVRRCFVALRRACPRGERNFYVADGVDDDD
jgi:hypothetical protein